MEDKTSEKNLQNKIKALQNIMNYLDSMSTTKETAFTILQGQFSDTFALVLGEELNKLIG